MSVSGLYNVRKGPKTLESNMAIRLHLSSLLNLHKLVYHRLFLNYFCFDNPIQSLWYILLFLSWYGSLYLHLL